MKRFIIMSIISFLVMVAAPLFALNVIVGAKAGYFVWHPYFQDMDGSGIEQIDKGDGVLYGPVVSMIITPDISFSVAALTGKQSTHWSDNNTSKNFGNNDMVSTGTFYAEILRHDVDSALSYRFFKQFKIFFGYKYQYTETELKGEFRGRNIENNNEYITEGDVLIKIPSHGPALGIGYSLAGDIFFTAVNVSAIYMWSKFDFERNIWRTFSPSGTQYVFVEENPMDASGFALKTRQIGLNIEPSAGLRVEGVIVTLGFRLQWMRTQFVDEPLIYGNQFAPKGWMNDYLYGVFVGLMYIL